MNTDQVTHGTGNLRRRVPGKWARIFLNHSRVTFHLQVVCCDSLAPKMPVLNVHEFENGPIIPKILVHIDGNDLPLKKNVEFSWKSHNFPMIFPFLGFPLGFHPRPPPLGSAGHDWPRPESRPGRAFWRKKSPRVDEWLLFLWL